MRGRTIAVVDQTSESRDAMCRMLKSAGAEPKGFASGAALLVEISTLVGDGLVTNLKLSDMTARELYHELARRGVNVPTIVVADADDLSEGVREIHAMSGHATDLLESPVDERDFVECFRRMFKRRLETEREITAEDAKASLALLTPRELEVLGQLVDGATNRRIAEALGISFRTVEVYRTRILLKTHTRRLPDLIRLAVTSGKIS